MIGKSYDGTLSNGVAATGVEGLKTIVPVSAISSWYLYSRTGGVRHNTNYPASLNNTVTTGSGPPTGVNLPERRTLCNPLWAPFSDDANVLNGDGDAHGDMNQFWRDRDHVKDAAKVKASVFITHGIQDDNVKMDQVGPWWDALKANGVQVKLWLLRAGHEDPFESRRAVWVDTLHRWFDHYLYGVANNIAAQPRVTIENEKDVWGDYADWPIPGTQNVDVYLRSAGQANAGNLGGQAGAGATDALTFTGHRLERDHADEQPVGLAGDPARVPLEPAQERPAPLGHRPRRPRRRARRPGQQPERRHRRLRPRHAGVQDQRRRHARHHRLLLGCRHRRRPVRGQGPRRRLHAAHGRRRSRTPATCNPVKPTTDVTQWRVTRGVLDSKNRNSLWYADASDVVPGEFNRYGVPDPADRAHLQGRQPDRDHRRRHEHERGLVDRQPEQRGRSRSTPRRAR